MAERLVREPRLPASRSRLRAFGWFFVAAVYAMLSQQAAAHGAAALVSFALAPLVARLFLLALLLAGFSAMGVLGQRQQAPLRAMGLALRPGGWREWGLGALLGWGGMVACVLPIGLAGTLLVTVSRWAPGVAEELVLDLLTLLIAALTDALIFRGYPYQRLIDAAGSTLATIFMAVLFTVGHASMGGRTAGGTLATLLLGFLLAMAYLRTRALWVGWGLQFAWNASMAVLFGLPVSGITSFAPVVSTYTSGPAWLTGGGYGPEGSAFAVLVLLVLLVVLARATRELRHQWALPEIVAAGMPVDLDAAGERQHRAAMGPQAPGAAGSTAGNALVQIAPASTAARAPEHPQA